MHKPLLILALLGITFGQAKAQENGHWCHTHNVYEEAYNEDPELYKSIEREIDEAVIAHSKTAHKVDPNFTYYIPVVFHYFHPEKETNFDRFFSAEDAQGVVDRLNADFNNTNPDSTDIQDFYKARRGNAHIKFLLADYDPDGNVSTGINYVKTDMALPANRNSDEELKYLSFWPNESYLNFWIVENLKRGGGVLAYATLPESVASGRTRGSEDGVIGKRDIYKKSPSGRFERHALSHEVGHYLGLRHPFQGDESIPGSGCSTLPCKFGGDKICDIPQVDTIHRQCIKEHNTCPNEPIIDNLTNIMDYRYCPAMFSKDQVTRMRGVLLTTRKYLVSWENHQKTGIQEKKRSNLLDKTEIYPNPFNNKIIIEMESDNDAQACIDIKDLLGRTAYNNCRRKLMKGQNTIEISAEEMNITTTGIYVITVQVGNNYYVERIKFNGQN